MAVRDFPSLAPTARTYRPGRLPETTFTAQNGATTFVQFGNTFVNAMLSLEFKNISDSDAADILSHYLSVVEDDSVRFNFKRGFNGMSSELTDQMESGDDTLRWRYAEPPEVSSVYPGVSTVQCSFEGFFYGA